jgi:2-aminoadipate transaminase
MNWNKCFAERTQYMRRSTVRELLKVLDQPGMISFAGGIPAPELFPIEETAQATARVLERRGRDALQYGATEGLAPLRDWIAARFSTPRFEVRRDNVLIVTGSQQGLDLLGKVFLDAGDRVLVENPTFVAMLSAWRPLQPDFVPVPSDEEGMCVDALPPVLSEGAKLIYLVPNFQNPQGTTLSLARRRQLLDLVRGRAVVIEDNPYGELRYGGEAMPHLVELDWDACLGMTSGAPVPLRKPESKVIQLDPCVIHLGTFSKILAPGFRVGWVVAPAEVIDKLVQAKQTADIHTSTFCQHVVLELIQSGLLEGQIFRLRAAYAARLDAMLSALERFFPAEATWTRPDGGMFLFVTLPEAIEAKALLQQALDCNVAFVPGEDFHFDDSGHNTFRLNFSNAAPEQIEEGVKRLASVIKDQVCCQH